MKIFYDTNKMQIISLENVRQIYLAPECLSMKNIIIEYMDGYELKLYFDSHTDANSELNKIAKILSENS